MVLSSADTPPHRRPGRGALIFAVASIAVLVGTTLWFWIAAPEKVPSHFGLSGQPDDWSSKGQTLAILVPLGLGLAVLFSVRAIWERLPVSIINAPEKDYWLRHGQRDYLYDCLMVFLRIMAGAVALLFAAILVTSLTVAQGASLPDGLLFVLPAGFIVVAVIATWNLSRQLKPQVKP